MKKNFFTLLIVMTWLLSACAQAVPTDSANPTKVLATPSDDEANIPYPYPYPAPGKSAAAATEVYNPYPDADQSAGTDPSLANTPLHEQKRLNTLFAPEAGDVNWSVGPVYLELENSQMILAEGDPVQAKLHLVGNVPNPCYRLRVLVHEPNEQGQLMVDVYSVADPEKVCADMLQPFDEVITIENLPAGKYIVFLNEEEWERLKIK